MTITRYEQNHGTAPVSFAYAGTGWTGGNAGNQTFAYLPSSGGTHAVTSHAGDTCTITFTGGNSLLGALLMCLMTGASAASDATVKLDNNDPVVWNQRVTFASGATLTTDVEQFWLPQACFPPLTWAATDPTGAATHTIVITAGTNGATSIDAVDVVDTTNGPVIGSLVGLGMSQLYAFTEHSPLVQTKITPNLLTVLGPAAALTTILNQAIPGSDLTNGGNAWMLTATAVLTGGNYKLTWATVAATIATANIAYNATVTTINGALTTAGIPCQVYVTAGATTPFVGSVTPITVFAGNGSEYGTLSLTNDTTTGGALSLTTSLNPVFYSNGYSPEPEWRRAATAAPTASQQSWGVNAFVESYGNTWAARRPEVAVLFHHFNDIGYLEDLYDNPGTTGGLANGATAVARVHTITAGSPTAPTSGVFRVSDGTNSTGDLSPLADVASMQITMDASALAYTLSGPGGSALGVAGNVLTLTAKTAGVSNALSITNNTTNNNGIAMAQVRPGRAARPGGVGFGVARFKQRLRETIWRMNLASPKTIVLVGGLLATPSYIGSAVGYHMNRTVAEVCGESTLTAYFVDCYTAAQDGGAASGYAIWQENAFAPGTQGGHLTAAGHALVAAQFARVLRRAKAGGTIGLMGRVR